jgi:hypothetical protein
LICTGFFSSNGLLNATRSAICDPTAVTAGPSARLTVIVLAVSSTYFGGVMAASTREIVSRGSTVIGATSIWSSPAVIQTFMTEADLFASALASSDAT